MATRESSTAVQSVVETIPKRRAGSAEGAPATVTLPLRERMRLIEAGDIALARWHAEAAEWSYRADERYRACADLRAPAPDAAPIRLGVKDTVDVAGFPTRLGLRRYRHYPRRSAAPLRWLSGVTVNAKVVATELNIGIGSGCVNPYFPQIDPAGSSTGSAVAVAAGICDVSLGTDVLGSVRWPAGRCGVVGLRVTHDERWLPGVFPLSPAMDAPGWVTRSADDLAFLWDRIGLDGRAAGRPPAPRAPRRARVGLPHELLQIDLDADIRAALDVACAALSESGHDVTRAALGESWNWRGAAWELCARDAWDGSRAWRRSIADDLLESTRLALETGEQVSDARYAEVRQALWRQRAEITDVFAGQRIDAWLLPLDPDVPQPVGTVARAGSSIPRPDDPGYDRDVGFTPVASFLGLPAITFPAGCSRSNGAPLALQLVGAPDSESALISLAQDIGGAVEDLGFRPR